MDAEASITDGETAHIIQLAEASGAELQVQVFDLHKKKKRPEQIVRLLSVFACLVHRLVFTQFEISFRPAVSKAFPLDYRTSGSFLRSGSFSARSARFSR